MSQAEMAAKLKISRTAYHNYIRGEREIPVSVLDGVEREFGFDPIWMLRGESKTGLNTREDEMLDIMGQIFCALDNRILERGINISPEKRWIMMSRLFADFKTKQRLTSGEPNMNDLSIDTYVEIAT